MKRSESVLVYGVTGVLAVILGIAIIFGGETPDRTDLASGDAADGRGRDIPFLSGDRVDDAERELRLLLEDEDPVTTGTDAEPETELDPAPALGTDSGEVRQPVEVPLHRTVQLGISRTEENPASGERFRFVRAKPGDSLAVLIQRWCPGVDSEIVAALNEDQNLTRLHPGDEVCVPWVDDAILIEAMEARQSSPIPAASPVRDAGIAPVAAVGTTYTLKEGDSLWLVAKRRVGVGKADAYVREILESNPSIADAAAVRAGQKIVLPN
ncbi:MAG: LysM peptidoglycan-binding domain-containing protein [Planctomycetes bacterium]|nr:LysM peptidoglycan-binding domain-containing protein [Planctomycetota bacterium]